MGKSLDDLNLSDDPLPPVRTSTGTRDPRQTAWYRFVEAIDDLLATGTVNWAESTLLDIQETVRKTERVTEGQRKAVENIEQAGQRPRRGSSRRYY